MRRPGPTAAARPAATRDLSLSVLVVFHNMRREAARTLHSLSRAYQRDIEDLDYEVIAIENGSAADGRLGEDFVRSFGPEFNYLDLGDRVVALARARPEPRRWSSHGDAPSRVMIDGAHVLTPGVLHFGDARAVDLRARGGQHAAVVRGPR